MKELRQLERAIVIYTDLLNNDQENARNNKNFYAENVDKLISVTDSILEGLNNSFHVWCAVSVEVDEFFADGNIFYRLLGKLFMVVVNHFLYKHATQITRAGKIKESFNVIRRRFTQYQILLH